MSTQTKKTPTKRERGTQSQQPAAETPDGNPANAGAEEQPGQSSEQAQGATAAANESGQGQQIPAGDRRHEVGKVPIFAPDGSNASPGGSDPEDDDEPSDFDLQARLAL